MRGALLAMLLLASCGGGSEGDALVGPDVNGDDAVADVQVGPDLPGDSVGDITAVDGLPDRGEPDDVAADGTKELPDLAAPDVDPEEWAKQYGKGCQSEDRVGLFEVVWAFGTSGVSGQVNDSVNTGLVMEKAGEEGPCVLLKRVEPFCNPACSGGQRCAPGDKCKPFPKPLSAGTVSVKGLVKPVSMELAGNMYFDTDFEGMAWEPGALIELVASGGAVESFSLQGAGVAPLAIPFADWVLSKGSPMSIEWNPSDGPGQVHVEINLVQHASNSHDLVCVLEDTGKFTIPQKLTDALIDLGVAGAPVVLIFRRTVDSVEVEQGCVEFQVKAYGTAYLTLK